MWKIEGCVKFWNPRKLTDWSTSPSTFHTAFKRGPAKITIDPIDPVAEPDPRCFWIVVIMKTSRKTSCHLALCGHVAGIGMVWPYTGHPPASPGCNSGLIHEKMVAAHWVSEIYVDCTIAGVFAGIMLDWICGPSSLLHLSSFVLFCHSWYPNPYQPHKRIQKI